MCTQCVHEVSGEYSPEAHPCQFSTRAPSGGNYAKLDGFAGEYSLAARPCHEGLDCHTKFLGSTPWQRSLAATPMAGALLGSTSMAGEYSSASLLQDSDAISLQTMFC